jgi:DNA-binding NarL/FixJ family response regulator
MQVCALVAEGLPNKDIAARLQHRRTKKPLSDRTVACYLQIIFLKAGVDTRAGLVTWLFNQRLLMMAPTPAKRR